jgi:hypothetical protein
VSWDLFSCVLPSLHATGGASVEAQAILKAIARHNSARETYMMITENLSMINWDQTDKATTILNVMTAILEIGKDYIRVFVSSSSLMPPNLPYD